MWNFLVNFSRWVENNSGQIQIIIAMGAIWLAFAGYKKVLEQINISYEQTNLATRQEDLNLSWNIISVTIQTIEAIGKMLNQLPFLKQELESIHKALLKNGDPDAAIIKKNINSVNNQEEELENNRKQLAELAESISKSGSDIKNDYLKTVSNILVRSTNNVIEYHLMIHNIEDIKREKKLI